MSSLTQSGALATRNSLASQVVLLLAGTVAAFVGVSLLSDPHHFYSSYGFDLGDNPSLLSEVRGTAGLLVFAAGALLTGAFAQKHRALAAALGGVLYFGYAFGRALSMWLDGFPDHNLMIAALVELVLGLACVWAYQREALAHNGARP